MNKTRILPDIFYKDDDTFTIFTQSDRECPYCNRALEYLRNHNLPFVKFALKHEDIVELADIFEYYTVPVIFKGKDFVGGYTELLKGY